MFNELQIFPSIVSYCLAMRPSASLRVCVGVCKRVRVIVRRVIFPNALNYSDEKEREDKSC